MPSHSDYFFILENYGNLVLYQPGNPITAVWRIHSLEHLPIFAQGDPGQGIAGYDLLSPEDRAFAFNYDHSGKLDHVVLYRPGRGAFWITKNNGGKFSPVYAQGQGGSGIGGYDLISLADRSFTFDYDHSGKLDHVVLYRPGTGIFWIVKNDGGTFSPIFTRAPHEHIAGFNLLSLDDRAFAFDYDHSGKLDHVAFYRPGKGAFWIAKNNGGKFSPVYAQGQGGSGIGGYDLLSLADRSFAFDYDHSGKLDHVVLYRPGTGIFWIVKNDGGTFSPIFTRAPHEHIAGFDLLSPDDRAFTFDYGHSGKLDHVAFYRPGKGAFWIAKNNGGEFSPVYAQGQGGSGIGGYNLLSLADRSFTFDYDHSGNLDYVAFYRPGTGTF
jgi:hypothetical protein